MFKKIVKEKLVNIALIVVSLVTLVLSNALWDNCILTGACDSGEVDSIYRPLFYASLSLTYFFAFFLLLPTRYFTSWFKCIFSWLFPLGVLIVASNHSSGGGVFPIYERETIILYSIFAAIVTSIFLIFKYRKEKIN